MKNIVCFGDSNTRGAMPADKGRFPWEVRWTGRLQSELGHNFRVNEEGLDGRTTVWENPLRAGRNGLSAIHGVIETHSPIDLMVIMLGTNDVKTRLNQTPFSIAHGASRLVEICKEMNNDILEVLLISPPHVIDSPDVESQFLMEGAKEKSRELAKHYEYFAKKLNAHYFDAASVVQSSKLDGVHWDADQHQAFAKAIAKKIQTIF